MKRALLTLVLPITALILMISISASAAGIRAFVSIPPQKYFLHKIGGDLVEINVMVPPGADPHIYEPAPRQMVALSKADLYLTIGLSIESAWMEKFKSVNPRMTAIQTDAGIAKKPMAEHEAHEGHHHADELLDPHIWLSPPLVKIQAGNILKGLTAADPGNKEIYERNFAAFTREIDALDAQLRQKLKKGTEFMVFHPAWGYFADAYGLKQIPVEVEGKSPKAAGLQKLIVYAEKHHIRTVLVQPQFSTRDAEMVARSIHGKTAVADDLAENWAENLLHVADLIRSDRGQ